VSFSEDAERERALSALASSIAREVVLESNEQLIGIIEAQLLDYARKIVVVLARLRRAPILGLESNGESDVLTMDEARRNALQAALEDTGGNKTAAANLLGIDLKTVRNLARRYHMNGHLPHSEKSNAVR